MIKNNRIQSSEMYTPIITLPAIIFTPRLSDKHSSAHMMVYSARCHRETAQEARKDVRKQFPPTTLKFSSFTHVPKPWNRGHLATVSVGALQSNAHIAALARSLHGALWRLIFFSHSSELLLFNPGQCYTKGAIFWIK